MLSRYLLFSKTSLVPTLVLAVILLSDLASPGYRRFAGLTPLSQWAMANLGGSIAPSPPQPKLPVRETPKPVLATYTGSDPQPTGESQRPDCLGPLAAYNSDCEVK